MGWVLMGLLYLVYGADVVVTAITAAGLADELDTLEKIADSIHDVSDAMTGLIGSTAMDADQKLDESRLQLKLAGAELRSASRKLSAREVRRAARAKADEAMEAARHASEIARLNAAEAAKATRLAAAGTVDRAAELLRLEKLRAELEARADEVQAQMQRGAFFGAGRLVKAFPRMRHGRRGLPLDALRRQEDKDRGRDDPDGPSASA